MPVAADDRERRIEQVADRVAAAGADDVVGRLVLLQHLPHRGDVVAGEPPVAAGLEVAQRERVDQAGLDAGRGERDLPRDERLAPQRRLVVEQDARAREQPVRLAVVDRQMVGRDLAAGVRAARVQRRRLALRLRAGQAAEHLGRARLVEPHRPRLGQQADPFEHVQRALGVDLLRVRRLVEADADMALGGQVVDLVRLQRDQVPHRPGRIGHVAVVQRDPVGVVGALVAKLVDPLAVHRTAAADQPVHAVAVVEQVPGQVVPVLAGDAGDERGAIGGGVGHRAGGGEWSRLESGFKSPGTAVQGLWGAYLRELCLSAGH